MAHHEQDMADIDERTAEKALDSHVEDVSHTGAMRSKSDNISVWKSMLRYKVVGMVAMSAAFSASLDGYRKYPNEPIIQGTVRD
jgi:hypothetical protein